MIQLLTSHRGVGASLRFDFETVCRELRRARYLESDVAWAENCGPPPNSRDFALEAAFVICNSGMKSSVARGIYDRVGHALHNGRPLADVFRHQGKTQAIQMIWDGRESLWREYLAQHTDAERLGFLERLPWIGPITKWHLAKNFGADVCKPDVHLTRLAAVHEMTPTELCRQLADETGYRVATIDTLLWRACALGIIDSATGENRP